MFAWGLEAGADTFECERSHDLKKPVASSVIAVVNTPMAGVVINVSCESAVKVAKYYNSVSVANLTQELC